MTRFRLKSLFILQAGALISLVVGSGLGILQFYYPRAVENDPLACPVKVSSVTGSSLVLEHGRTLLVNSFGEPLDQLVQESDFRVEVEPVRDSADVAVFVKRRGWICGTPWVALIEIPLIPDEVGINRREPIGEAHVIPHVDTTVINR